MVNLEKTHMKNSLAIFILRGSIGLVFILFGIDKLMNPSHWVVFIPTDFVHDFKMDMHIVLKLQGLVELITGIHLLAGFKARWAAGVAAIILLLIIFFLGWDPVTIRDTGLLGACAALMIVGAGDWSVDARLGNGKFLFYALWMLGTVILVAAGWRLSQDVKKAPTQFAETIEDDDSSFIDEPIQPIPLTAKEDPKKAELGRKLFIEPKLSRDNTISCSSCHLLDKAGVDNRRKSIGVDGKIGDVNAPTVFNSAFNFKQFWDGRSDSLEDQINGPTHNHLEMDSNWNEIITKLKADPQYTSAFAVIYADGVTDSNIRDAIAAFERTLITPNSRFDRFLLGDPSVLTPLEKQGYVLFKERGCIVCHQGTNAGSNMFQSFGKFGNYFEDRGDIVKADYGRMNVTGKTADRYKFKVPTLRNIESTAPYFHDGSVTTLENAVEIMAKYQLGVHLDPEEIKAIVAFLKTLTGEYEGKSLGGNP